MASKTIKVFEVLYHSDNPRDAYAGAAGDGSFIARFRKRADAEAFARGKRCYSGDASVSECDAPRRLAQRWGLA
jgi:hypothetical protein